MPIRPRLVFVGWTSVRSRELPLPPPPSNYTSKDAIDKHYAQAREKLKDVNDVPTAASIDDIAIIVEGIDGIVHFVAQDDKKLLPSLRFLQWVAAQGFYADQGDLGWLPNDPWEPQVIWVGTDLTTFMRLVASEAASWDAEPAKFPLPPKLWMSPTTIDLYHAVTRQEDRKYLPFDRFLANHAGLKLTGANPATAQAIAARDLARRYQLLENA